jgi:hypothetical protein
MAQTTRPFPTPIVLRLSWIPSTSPEAMASFWDKKYLLEYEPRKYNGFWDSRSECWAIMTTIAARARASVIVKSVIAASLTIQSKYLGLYFGNAKILNQ